MLCVLGMIVVQMKGKGVFNKESLARMVRLSSDVYTRALAKLPMHHCDVPTLGLLLKAILAVAGRWFYYTKSGAATRSVKSITKDTRKDFTAFWLLFAAKVLEALGLGKVVMTAHLPGGVGNYNWYFAKRQVDASNGVAVVLGAFGITTDSTPSIGAYNASIEAETVDPPRAPCIQWERESVPSIAARAALLQK